MRVGIYLDGRNPEADRLPWTVFYGRTLELVEAAERLGADSVWLSEHHLFPDGYLPQPLILAAAIAARTRRVRIGTAVLLAPFRNAIHVAEEAAVVDILSGGRLVLGLGAGYVNWEFELFGAERRRRMDSTDQMVRDLRELLGPEGRVTPPSIQRPPEIWLGYRGPGGARRAGRLGTGLLSLDRALEDPYRAGLREAGHAAESARMAGLVQILVADDPDEAFERVLPHLAHQLNTYRAGAADGTGRMPSPITVEKLRARRQPADGVLPPLEVLTADEAIESIRRRTQGLPVEEVFLWTSFGGMPDDMVRRHVELLCSRVRPALASS